MQTKLLMSFLLPTSSCAIPSPTHLFLCHSLSYPLLPVPFPLLPTSSSAIPSPTHLFLCHSLSYPPLLPPFPLLPTSSSAIPSPNCLFLCHSLSYPPLPLPFPFLPTSSSTIPSPNCLFLPIPSSPPFLVDAFDVQAVACPLSAIVSRVSHAQSTTSAWDVSGRKNHKGKLSLCHVRVT